MLLLLHAWLRQPSCASWIYLGTEWAQWQPQRWLCPCACPAAAQRRCTCVAAGYLTEMPQLCWMRSCNNLLPARDAAAVLEVARHGNCSTYHTTTFRVALHSWLLSWSPHLTPQSAGCVQGANQVHSLVSAGRCF